VKDTLAPLRSTSHGFVPPEAVFRCEWCTGAVVIPQSVWTCLTCGEPNELDQQACLTCGHVKGIISLLCPTCHQLTRVPESEFSDFLKSETDFVHRVEDRVWVAAGGVPSVPCPSCKQAVPMPGPYPSGTYTERAALLSCVGVPTTSYPNEQFSIPRVCANCHCSFTVSHEAALSPIASSATPVAESASTGSASD
jgi:hypothetical protein